MFKITILSVIAWCATTISISGASQITHALVAQKFIDQCTNYTKKQKQAFIQGTLFPDIRYLANIPRAKTHVKNVSLQKVCACKDPFLAGKLFHVFVDDYRTDFVDSSGIYKKLTKIPAWQRVGFLKILEDEVLYEKHFCKAMSAYLLTVEPGSLKHGVAKREIKTWHKMLQEYFSRLPSETFIESMKKREPFMKFKPKAVTLLATQLPVYAKQKEIQKYAHNMIKHFEKAFRKFAQSKEQETVKHQ